jgi:hypothetical protein
MKKQNFLLLTRDIFGSMSFSTIKAKNELEAWAIIEESDNGGDQHFLMDKDDIIKLKETLEKWE